MRIIDPSYQILTKFTGHELEMIEQAGRTCYKSEDKITPESAEKFVRNLIKRGHEAMLEHGPAISVKFIVDRGVSHEIVRHRLFSFAQESTRYCNYNHEKFGNELTFIRPFFFEAESHEEQIWKLAMQASENAYNNLIAYGRSPQEARSVLPNSLKTEIIVTGNIREWRHFFWLRAARKTGPAHPQMEQVAQPLLQELHVRIPVVFDDIDAAMIESRKSCESKPHEGYSSQSEVPFNFDAIVKMMGLSHEDLDQLKVMAKEDAWKTNPGYLAMSRSAQKAFDEVMERMKYERKDITNYD